MNQRELIEFILDERKRQGYTMEQFEAKAEMSLRHLRGLLSDVPSSKDRSTVGVKTILKALETLGYTLDIKSVEDKREPVNALPPSLYFFDRVESRESIQREGVYPRIDLYESPATAMKFMAGPSDLYEVPTIHLLRFHITDVTRHPYGVMYSYNDQLKPEYIIHLMRMG